MLMSLYKDVEAGTYVPDTASSSWKDRKKEEQQLIDDLLVHFSKSSQSCPKTKARHTTAYRSMFDQAILQASDILDCTASLKKKKKQLWSALKFQRGKKMV